MTTPPQPRDPQGIVPPATGASTSVPPGGWVQPAPGAVWTPPAAAVTIRPLRRSPAWHAGSWFIPVVAWWFPFQNIKDLVGASRASVRTAMLGLWWCLWLASSLLFTISNLMSNSAETLPALTAATAVSALGELPWIAAAPFAWIIVTRITDAIDPAAR